MNAKKFLTLLAVIAIFFLGGCVAPPYYGATGYYGGAGNGYGYGYQQPLFYGNQRFLSGHIHIGGGHRHIGGGHRHFGGGHRGGGHRGGHHRW